MKILVIAKDNTNAVIPIPGVGEVHIKPFVQRGDSHNLEGERYSVILSSDPEMPDMIRERARDFTPYSISASPFGNVLSDTVTSCTLRSLCSDLEPFIRAESAAAKVQRRASPSTIVRTFR